AVAEPHVPAEQQREREVEDRPPHRLAHLDLVRAAGDDEVEGEQHQQTGDADRPEQWRCDRLQWCRRHRAGGYGHSSSSNAVTRFEVSFTCGERRWPPEDDDDNDTSVLTEATLGKYSPRPTG